jgi:quercetin dioxygenase-like cupin family protein
MNITCRTRTRAVAVLGGAAIACLTVAPPVVAQQPHTTRGARERITSTRRLPALDGGRLQVTLVEVVYGPGEFSEPHRHPCPVIGYVLEGALRMRVGNGPEVVYTTGEGFYEEPNADHVVSANASRTEQARFLAYFTCDHDEPLSAPIRHGGR